MLTQVDDTSSDSSNAELESFTAYFELLSQIDKRLMQEDSEYREKYFSGENKEEGCK